MSSEETFSINAAAKLTGFTIPTVRKRLPELKRAGAIQREGRWSIPLSALYACGLMSRVDSKELAKETDKPLLSETIETVNTLRAELAEALQRAAVAEAIASERGQALERADRALLMLEAAQVDKPRKRWFTR